MPPQIYSVIFASSTNWISTLIVAEQLPEEGLGAAINDRLRRAAHSALMRQAGLNESLEKRMWPVRFTLKFGVILAGDKIGVIPQLN